MPAHHKREAYLDEYMDAAKIRGQGRTPPSAQRSAPARHERRRSVVSSEQRMTLEIPRSQFARIRTWAKYGMTAAQIAGVYGVGIDAIERILGHA